MTQFEDRAESVEGKRLLVLGASPMRAAAFRTWARMGLRVTLIDGHSQGRYEDLVDEFLCLDVRDASADLEELIASAGVVDGVVTLTDDSQLVAARFAERTGLKGSGFEAAQAGRSKDLQRAALAAAGMRVPRWAKVSGPDDLETFFNPDEVSGAGDAVLKPTDAAGGAAALRVPDLMSALRHWPVVRALSPSGFGVIESFLPGREICVDAVVQAGQVVFSSAVHCEHMTSVGFLCTSSSYETAMCVIAGRPSQCADAIAAFDMTAAVARALKMQDGILHAEFKIDNGTWTTVEAGMRPGGALVPELTEIVSGVNLYAAQARLALGTTSVLLETATATAPFAQARYLVGEGKVRQFVPPASVTSNLPDVKVACQQLFGGQFARVPLSEAGRAGYAYGWGDKQTLLDIQLRQAVDRLGDGMGLTVRGNDPLDPLASPHGPGPWWLAVKHAVGSS